MNLIVGLLFILGFLKATLIGASRIVAVLLMLRSNFVLLLIEFFLKHRGNLVSRFPEFYLNLVLWIGFTWSNLAFLKSSYGVVMSEGFLNH